MPEEIEGRIQSIVFRAADGTFSVARILRDGSPEPVTAAGYLAGTGPGERVRLKGDWETHSRFGRQFKVTECMPLLPASAEGVEAYLGSGLVEGIGPEMARRIVRRFGADALRVIDEEPKLLSEVPGIGPKRITAIGEAWRQQRGVREAMLFLQSHGVSPAYAARIYRQYGDRAVQVVRDNPYRLAEDVEGIGFLTADKIARGLGFLEDSPHRAEAGILHTLSKAAEEGHMFLSSTDLLQQAQKILECDREILSDALQRMAAARRVVAENLGLPSEALPAALPQERAVYLPALLTAEDGIVEQISRLRRASRALPAVDAETAAARAQKALSITLAPKQAEAITRALTEKLLVITGGPGTGKTTIQRALISVLSSLGARTLLAAPTGRAAKRLGEATGQEARTIHRLLEYMPREKRFRRGQEEPLECDALVVDEASMIDAPLMHKMLLAVPSGASLIIVGDAHQLPSIGPGAVLSELIASATIPVVELTEIFRQSGTGSIVTNAHRINLGLTPLENGSEEPGDFFFIEQDDPARVAKTVVELVCRRIPQRFHMDPMEDVQVLSPMHRGEAGVENLNALLREELNPAGSEIAGRGRSLRAHDKVMQLRNDYEREVYNGDMGRVSAADPESGQVTVEFEGRSVEYKSADLGALMPAYAVSVHKAQGAEFPAVIVPLLTQHFPLLQRNLLYTAVTRGKRLVVIVGSRKALAIALKNDKPRKRNSRLAVKLAAARAGGAG